MAQRRSPGRVDIYDLWRKRDGSPSKRDGTGKRWRVAWIDNDGHQKSESFHRKLDAKDREKELVTSFTTGAYIDPKRSRTTVTAVYDEWLPGQVQWKGKTLGDNKSTWRTHVEPKWGGWEVGAIMKADVQAWIGEMKDAGRGQSTITHAVHLLQGVLGHAVDARHLAANPAVGVKLPKATPARNIYLTVSQVEALAEACGEYRPLIRLLAYTGLRWGEATALRVDAVDRNRRRLAIFRNDEKTETGVLVDGTTKSRKGRTVSFVQQLDEVVRDATDGKRSDARLFTSPEGKVLRGSNFSRRVWKDALKAVRVADPTFPSHRFTIHDLRHTAATLMVQAGANVKAVQRQLGHRDATTTLNTYADLFDDELDDVAVRMSGVITRATE